MEGIEATPGTDWGRGWAFALLVVAGVGDCGAAG